MEAPNGSRWYLHGRHYVVAEQTTRDGEPAVRIKAADDARQTNGRRRGRTIITRLLVRHGQPSEAVR